MNEQTVMNEVPGVHELTEPETVDAIHLPPPSWAPIILALGLTGVCFGVVLSAVVLVIGVALLLSGLSLWIYDEIQHASQEDAEEQRAEGAS